MSLFDRPGHIYVQSNGVRAEIPLAPALVLFGANDAGKTNVLRAIASLIRGDDPDPRDAFLDIPAGGPGWAYSYGDQAFDAVVCPLDLTAREDQQFFLGLATAGMYWRESAVFRISSKRNDEIVRVEPEEDHAFPSDAGYEEMGASLVTQLRDGLLGVAAQDEQLQPSREGAIDHALRRSHVELGAKIAALHLHPWRLRPDGPGTDESPEDDPGEDLPLAVLRGDTLPEFVELVSSEAFDAPMVSFLGDLIHKVLRVAGWERTESGYEWAFVGEGEYHDQRSDPWFYEGRPAPAVVDACAALSRLATELAPRFVTSDYVIELQPLDPGWWYLNEGERLRVALVRRDAERVDYDEEPNGFGLDAVGAGLRIWTMFAVHEAIRRTSSRGKGTTVFLLDEPERHLHPAAQREAASFISSMVSEGANVIVATHAPAFLNEPIAHVRHVRLSRVDGKTRAFPLGEGRLKAIERVRSELGLTQADLIQLTRGVLLVEGQQDRVVVEGFFGKELADAHTRVFTLRGADNALAVVDADLLGDLGIPVALMLDNTSQQFVDDVTAGRVTPTRRMEERALATLATELKLKRLSVTPIALDVPDVVWTIPQEVVKEFAPAFPGWAVATADLRKEGRPINPKKLIEERYGLRVDVRTVRRMVSTALDRGLAPAPVLKGAVAAVIEAAGSARQ